DPHVRPEPERRVGWYRDRCLQCHAADGPERPKQGTATAAPCSLPRPKRLAQDPKDSCIDCHMPAVHPEDAGHTAFTDHRILRPGHKPAEGPGKTEEEIPLPLTHFHRGPLDRADRATARDWGLALGDQILN